MVNAAYAAWAGRVRGGAAAGVLRRRPRGWWERSAGVSSTGELLRLATHCRHLPLALRHPWGQISQCPAALQPLPSRSSHAAKPGSRQSVRVLGHCSGWESMRQSRCDGSNSVLAACAPARPPACASCQPRPAAPYPHPRPPRLPRLLAGAVGGCVEVPQGLVVIAQRVSALDAVLEVGGAPPAVRVGAWHALACGVQALPGGAGLQGCTEGARCCWCRWDVVLTGGGCSAHDRPELPEPELQ